MIEAKGKLAVFKDIEGRLKSNSPEMTQMKELFSKNDIGYSTGDSLEQLSHFRDQLKTTNGQGMSMHPGYLNSVELGVNGTLGINTSLPLIGDFNVNGGGELSFSFDAQGSGHVNLGVMGAIGKTPLEFGLSGDGKYEASAGWSLLGSSTASAYELGDGASIEVDGIAEFNISKPKLYFEAIAGTTLDNKNGYQPKHSFFGIGQGLAFNKNLMPSGSLSIEVLGETSTAIHKIKSGSFNKAAFNTLSGILEIGGTMVNVLSTFGASPYGHYSGKPLNYNASFNHDLAIENLMNYKKNIEGDK